MPARFIDSSEISPFATYKGEQQSVSSLFYYYEWNGKEKKWITLSPRDPLPPATLPAGKFDGQIIEIPRKQ